MKKTLLAAALLTGYAGAAMAQNSVTLYGVVDLGLNYQSIKPGAGDPAQNAATQFGMTSGFGAASRFGLRGVEDLGNGLKANFVYEQAINAADGTAANFTRQSTLGLVSDSWGAVDLGRRSAPSTAAFSGIDPFASSYGTSSLSTTIGTNFYRLSNMVMYSSPSISGFRAFAGYSFDTGLTTAGTPTGKATGAAGTRETFGTGYKSRAASVGLRYANGPILLAATYDVIMAPGVRGSFTNTSTIEPLSSQTQAKNFNTWALGGTYDLKVVKLHAAYSQGIDGVLNNTATIASVSTGGDTNTASQISFAPGARTQSWMVGLSAPLGSGSVFASIQQKLPGGNLKELDSANELGASIGYRYNLSNRTTLYAAYSYLNNAAMVKDATANTASVGIWHQF